MLEKVEAFVRWVSHDDESYSVSKTCDSRMIVIVRNAAAPVQRRQQDRASPQQQEEDRASPQQLQEDRASPQRQSRVCAPPQRKASARSLNPDCPEFLPSSQSSSGTNLGRDPSTLSLAANIDGEGCVDENNNVILATQSVPEIAAVATSSAAAVAPPAAIANSSQMETSSSSNLPGSDMEIQVRMLHVWFFCITLGVYGGR